MKGHLATVAVAGVYTAISKVIFDKIYNTSQSIIDELFHIPQGLQICNFNYTYWDPKITTLPGLYLISNLFVGTWLECNIYNLRFVNLLASVVNIFLFKSLLRDQNDYKNTIQALNLTILPTPYFFSHVYYTDVLSITCLLIFLKLSSTNNYYLITLSGFLSVLMRQTNIVWIGFVFLEKVIIIFISSYKYNINKKSNKNNGLHSLSDFSKAIKFHATNYFKVFVMNITKNEWFILFSYIFLLISFIIFVLINGSIVVGDKSAHTATINIPQLFYFTLFYGVFGLFFVLRKLKSTSNILWKRKYRFIIILIMFVFIVKYNTLVHTYTLSDNRHYTFYIWNRWYGKYWFGPYLVIPIYLILLISIYDNLRTQNCISFLIPFTICLITSLALQKMVEVRYFLIPYLVVRMKFENPSWIIVFCETFFYVLINIVTLNIFFTGEIYWSNLEEVQRLTW